MLDRFVRRALFAGLSPLLLACASHSLAPTRQVAGDKLRLAVRTNRSCIALANDVARNNPGSPIVRAAEVFGPFESIDDFYSAHSKLKDPVLGVPLPLEGRRLANPKTVKIAGHDSTLFHLLSSDGGTADVYLALYDGQIAVAKMLRKDNTPPGISPAAFNQELILELQKGLATLDALDFAAPRVFAIDKQQSIVAMEYVPGIASPGDPTLQDAERWASELKIPLSAQKKAELRESLIEVIKDSSKAAQTIQGGQMQVAPNDEFYLDHYGSGNLKYFAGHWWWIDP